MTDIDTISKLAALADPAKNDNENERAVAVSKLGFGSDLDITDREQMWRAAMSALVVINQQLADADTLPDIRNVRDLADHMRKLVRDRQLGIETENVAARVVYTAEWKAGKELIRMAEDGERAGLRRVPILDPAHDGSGRAQGALRGSSGASEPTLADLGVAAIDAHRWQKLARIYDTEQALRNEMALRIEGDPDKRLARSSLLEPSGKKTPRPPDPQRILRRLQRERERDIVLESVEGVITAIEGLRPMTEAHFGTMRLTEASKADLRLRLRRAGMLLYEVMEAINRVATD